MLGRHQPPTEAQKKGEHYHAYCLFHFIIFILHHPNVVLCRYHRPRIDKGWIRGALIDGAIQGRRARERKRSAWRRIDTREAGTGKEMRSARRRMCDGGYTRGYIRSSRRRIDTIQGMRSKWEMRSVRGKSIQMGKNNNNIVLN